MNLDIFCGPQMVVSGNWDYLLLNPKLSLLIYTYCFNKYLLRYTTETLWEKKTETWEKKRLILYSTDISFHFCQSGMPIS